MRRIVEQFVERSEQAHELAHVGIELDDDEQRRRWVIKSVLRLEGLELEAYRARFGGDPCLDMPLLARLADSGHLDHLGDRIVPTALGLEQSDAIGPALVSDAVRRLSTEWEAR